MTKLKKGKFEFVGFDGMSKKQLEKLSEQILERTAPKIAKLAKPRKKKKENKK